MRTSLARLELRDSENLRLASERVPLMVHSLRVSRTPKLPFVIRFGHAAHEFGIPFLSPLSTARKCDSENSISFVSVSDERLDPYSFTSCSITL